MKLPPFTRRPARFRRSLPVRWLLAALLLASAPGIAFGAWKDDEEEISVDKPTRPGVADDAALKKIRNGNIRFISATPDILPEIADPSQYIKNPSTLGGAQLFYDLQGDMHRAAIELDWKYRPVWHVEHTSTAQLYRWGRLDNLKPAAAYVMPPVDTKDIDSPAMMNEHWIAARGSNTIPFWTRPSTAFYAWPYPPDKDAPDKYTLDFSQLKTAVSEENGFILPGINTAFEPSWTTFRDALLAQYAAQGKTMDKYALENIRLKYYYAWFSSVTGFSKAWGNIQGSFGQCPWEDMLECRRAASWEPGLAAEAGNDEHDVGAWLGSVNGSAAPAYETGIPQWGKAWQLRYDHRLADRRFPRYVVDFMQILNQSRDWYDGFLCLKDCESLEFSHFYGMNGRSMGRFVPLSATITWLTTTDDGKGKKTERPITTSLARGVIMTETPAFKLLAIACDHDTDSSARDAITILKEYEGAPVCAPEYCTVKSGVKFEGGHFVLADDYLKYERPPHGAKVTGDDCGVSYRAGSRPTVKVLFAVSGQCFLKDGEVLTLSATKDKTLQDYSDVSNDRDMNYYTFKNTAVGLQQTGLRLVGQADVNGKRHRIYEAEMESVDDITDEIRMSFMAHNWMLQRGDGRIIGGDYSRMDHIFTVFGESTLHRKVLAQPQLSKGYFVDNPTKPDIASMYIDLTRVWINGDEYFLRQKPMRGNFWIANGASIFDMGVLRVIIHRITDINNQESAPFYGPLKHFQNDGQDNTCYRPWVSMLKQATKTLLIESQTYRDVDSLAWPSIQSSNHHNVLNFAHGIRCRTLYNRTIFDHPMMSSCQYLDPYLVSCASCFHVNMNYYRHDTQIDYDVDNRLPSFDLWQNAIRELETLSSSYQYITYRMDMKRFVGALENSEEPLLICSEASSFVESVMSMIGFHRIQADLFHDHISLNIDGVHIDPTPGNDRESEVRFLSKQDQYNTFGRARLIIQNYNNRINPQYQVPIPQSQWNEIELVRDRWAALLNDPSTPQRIKDYIQAYINILNKLSQYVETGTLITDLYQKQT